MTEKSNQDKQNTNMVERKDRNLVEPGNSSLDVLANRELSKTGLLDSFFSSSIRSAKKLEAQKIVFNNTIQKMKHQSDTDVRMSKAYWDAKAAEACEKIKGVSQASLAELESERAENRADARILAVERIHGKIMEVDASGLPDEAKEMLIGHLGDDLQAIIDSINSRHIAKKYGLD